MQNQTTRLDTGVDTVFEAIARWVSNYRKALGTSRELAQCGPEAVAAIAQDLMLSPGELVNIARKGPDGARLLHRLLVALGVDGQALARRDPLVMRDLERLCVSCSQKRRCAHDLAAGTSPGQFKQYCPNAYTLETLFAGNGQSAPVTAARG